MSKTRRSPKEGIKKYTSKCAVANCLAEIVDEDNKYVIVEVLLERNKIETVFSVISTIDIVLKEIEEMGFEEEKEYEQVLKILEKLDVDSSEYAEKYSIMGQIYYIKNEFQKVEKFFQKAAKLCEENMLPYRYRESILACAKSQFMNGKYKDVVNSLETNIKELKWNDEIDVEMVSVLVLVYIKLEYEEQTQRILSEIEKT